MTEKDASENASREAGGGVDKRRVARYSLIATAEILDIDTTTRVNARVSEISLHGCYLDVLNPLPAGSVVAIRIVRDTGVFRTKARIVYIHPGFGMGVSFLETDPAEQAILEKWLAELPG